MPSNTDDTQQARDVFNLEYVLYCGKCVTCNIDRCPCLKCSARTDCTLYINKAITDNNNTDTLIHVSTGYGANCIVPVPTLISSFRTLHVRWQCPTRMALAVTKGSNIAQAGLANQKCVPEERQQCAVELLSAL